MVGGGFDVKKAVHGQSERFVCVSFGKHRVSGMRWRKSSRKMLCVTVLSGGKLWVALLEVQVGREPALIAKESFSIEETSATERKRVVHNFLARAGRRVLFRHIVLRDKAFTKQFQFPSRDMNEIKQMLNLRLPREIPSGLDEIVYHFHPIQGKGDEGLQTSVLVFCVSKELLNQEREALRSFGILPQQIFLSSVALISYAERKVDTKSGLPKVITVGFDGKGEVLLMNRYGIQFSRTFSYETADAVSSVQDALLPIFEFIEHKEGVEAYDFCVGGDIERLASGLFSAHEPAYVSLYRGQEQLSSTEFLLLAGAYVSEEDRDRFNLLPEEVKRTLASARSQVHIGELRFVISLTALVFALLSLCGVGRTSLAIWVLNQKAEALEPSVREIKEAVRSIQTFRKIQREKIRPLDLLAQVHEKAPAGISLGEFEYDEKEGFARLKGRSESQSLINQYVRFLQELEWFSRVDLQYSESISEGMRSQFQFAIQMTLKGKSEK